MNTTQELGKAMYETICAQGRLIQELQDQLANCARLKNPQTAAENVLVGNAEEQEGQAWHPERWIGYQKGLAERAEELESKKRISEAWKAECERLGNVCDRLSKEADEKNKELANVKLHNNALAADQERLRKQLAAEMLLRPTYPTA